MSRSINTIIPRLTRSLQTSTPLPPPVNPIPPIASSSKLPTNLSHLPPLIPTTPSPLPTSTNEAINLIRSQSTPQHGRYITARLHSRTYLLHPRDILTLPTLKPLIPPGSSMALTRILEVGSREYAITSPANNGREILKRGGDISFLKDLSGVVSCSVTVIEHTKSPLTRTILKKRRKGYKKTIENKQGWTRLRVGDIFLSEGV